ncbi:MAG: STAS domain-containing protein [Sulfuriflexus sp.]|nr:STAS domain-containing protein [Sulfuriflexus sp.]
MSEEKKEVQVINCQESLDISVVADLGTELKVALDSGQSIRLQAGDVGKADAAALQLLCAFFLDAQTHGIDIEWLDPSDALIESASLTGLVEHLGLKEKTLH